MKRRWPELAFIAALLLVNLYLVNDLVSGEHGLIAWKGLEEEVIQKQDRLEALEGQERVLDASIKGLRADVNSPEFDRDLLEERARAVLGVTQSDEFVVYVDRFLKDDK